MIEFDPEKDAANIAKHGVSLRVLARLDRDEAVVVADDRRDYGEPRWIAFQEVDGRVHAFVFTVRNGVTRAISARKANERERRFFERQRTGRDSS
jgi:uncharacterized DUF497 family protein